MNNKNEWTLMAAIFKIKMERLFLGLNNVRIFRISIVLLLSALLYYTYYGYIGIHNITDFYKFMRKGLEEEWESYVGRYLPKDDDDD